MHLDQLLRDIPAKIYGKVESIPVRNLTRDSRCTGVGDIFIARQGQMCNGNDYSGQAVENGAIAILSSLYNPFLSVVQIVTEDLTALEACLAARFYNDPSKRLDVIGVTGTNGKTTVSALARELMEYKGRCTGLVGTIEHILGEHRIIDSFTTPDAILLQKYFAEMVKQNLSSAVVEVSSIGLALGRVRETEFLAGVLTNVSLDHLDFHGSFEEYVVAKKQLFVSLPEHGVAVVNSDCEYAQSFLEISPARGVSYAVHQEADYRAVNLKFSSLGSTFDILYQGNVFSCETSLVGEHNVYNVLAALSVVHQILGGDFAELVHYVRYLSAPKGRLEPVLSGPCPIYIDYAHTPDALDNVCKILSQLLPADGRLIIVFGCGGDRDHSKRPIMAKVAETYGFSVVTSDNPRTEDPDQIIADICSGFSTDRYVIESDRRLAIVKAISMALDKDIVLVAGKGHEVYQIFKHQTIVFDDREVVCEALASIY
ncbi:UDP-N-acetylmuramoyl-L-alanyl-D-glutamate--2,6-diaminopimelate ligase [Chlamydia muridarum str. Nigg]|uniref:UDP-N-acetylmuramoyl-L-alanyl-D-glutamate--2,6-diaminopimelate ligase n=2 Tax=Chlamydia muridarum TaxID=83560 RepID=MURE_CHLMU|nr:UDP-N-acetylmuramoyl-L-alanyl-D-glutamate--2,6-diaminopimelate ligase [Chlamydia muridarum]Q9PKC6.2 RecName: Full=UDP-N-acetylmuramoyl-L-alanyl-D-glutamate--2,6-diaminopimelate ligase; AltName: Full=Meso-A2pm-adding enzyme; AltName: Full=Meso-diaminopimelate-adding enzyme; AltName: Full=UDP-MurNAc-L-Ala-D-Glu:meso-diaminopimelate ligase; AltName: Full=UDP-MurNAc-tripeptide synthetase; AltName: Full=UDP-N-acetylmuramyl-tripeptide synthetase [Chlamydia muridarum str. Nigg]UFW37682.1 UDP-N-acetyl